jgi:hypothetical protein
VGIFLSKSTEPKPINTYTQRNHGLLYQAITKKPKMLKTCGKLVENLWKTFWGIKDNKKNSPLQGGKNY